MEVLPLCFSLSLLSFIKKIREVETRKDISYGNWILVGSGNYERIKDDGRYRENCNTYRETITCENHKISSLKPIFNHCKKLDCETCFMEASSERARSIASILDGFKTACKDVGIKIGRFIHIVLSPNDIEDGILLNFPKFLKFRRKITKMMEQSGIFTGVIFTHIWTFRCKECGKIDHNCRCKEKMLVPRVKPHFHVLGYGYILNTSEFIERYPDWVIVNYGRRNNAYHTAFYSLTHGAIWRKVNGRLSKAYSYFGFLQSKKCTPIERIIKYTKEKCVYCQQPLKKVKRGIEILGDSPQVDTSISLKHTAKLFGIKPDGLTQQEIKTAISKCVYRNSNFKIKPSKNIELGAEFRHKVIVKKYQINDIDALTRIMKNNRTMYKEDKKRRMFELKKEKNNDYG